MARSTILFVSLAGAVAIGSAAYTTLSSSLGKRSLLTVVASGIALLIFASVSASNYGNKGRQLIKHFNRQDIFSFSHVVVLTEMQDYR